MTRAIGIEVGARRCLAAETHDGEAAVIEVDGAPCSLPSVVCLAPDGALVVGERARRLGLMRPRYGLADLPRHLESRLEALSSGRPACVTLAGARGELRVRLDGLTDVYVDRSKKAGASDDDSDEVAIAGGGSVRAAGDGRDEAGADDDALDEASAGADDDALDDVEATGEVADDASAGEAAGEANDGEATGVAAGEASAGEATGEAAGEARGEATGVAAGEASGEATGEATGEASGEATGEASDGEATGEAAGEASSADDDDIDIDADVDDDAEVLADAAGDAGSSDPASRGQDGVHTVPGLLGLVLTELRRRAERGAPGSWGPVILTTPAALGVVGRVALRDACDLAGLSVARFILRTTAIGLEHRARRVARGEVFEGPTPVLVIDHGHGSFEVAVVDLDDAGLEVKAVEGLGELGGWAFCERVVEWLRERFTDGEATAFDATIRERMLDAASKAVARLSEAEEVELHLPFLSADESGPRHLRETLTQARFTSLVEDLTRRCVDAMRRVLDRAGVRPEQLDAIVMAGGCSHLPCLQEQVETLCKREPLLELDDAACARGAARLAAGLGDADDDDDERSLRVRERVTHPLWIGDAKGGVVELIPRGRPLPVRVEHRLTERRALYHEGVDASGALGQPLGFVAPGRSPTTAFLFDESHALSISSGRVTLPLEDAPGLSPVERAAAIEAARADEAAYVRARVSAERRERLERWLGRAEQLLADRRPPAEGDGEASPTDRVLAPLEEALAGVREALAEGDDARLEQSDAALAELLDALPGDIAGHIRREPSPVGRDRFPRVSTLEEEEPQEAEDDSAPESGKVGKRPPPRVA